MRIYPGRFRSTEITFGPVGRVAITLALLLPVFFFWQSAPFGLVGLVVWVVGVLPRALRDVWREVPHPGHGREERAHLMAPRPDSGDDVPITERETPTRW
jgi:hypothetical protein